VSRFAEVDRRLDEAVGPVFPAAQIVIVDGGEEVHARAAGACDLQTWFDLASLTKPLVTGLCAMLLVDEGLDLEAEARPGVSLRLLLCHASGLPAWQLLVPLPGYPDVTAGVVARIQKEPLVEPPGTVARYSDLGFILLGAELAARLGVSLDEAFTARIARPLGLAARYNPPDPARCAPTEGTLRGVVHDDNARTLGGVAGHAGLFGPARDVARLAGELMAAFHGAPALVRPETVRRFFTPSGVPGSTWCLAWDRPAAGESQAGRRWPRDGVGHLGFTGCSLWLDPPRRRAVVLVSNRVHPTRENDAIKRFRPALHDAVVAALED
jgi:CubicO group peptidase (beta-lactamase class C family)